MLEILQSGLHTSIQDLGRFDYRNYGVPVSGVMDDYHAKLANQILGNDENAAVLEMTLQGTKLKFHENTQIVLCGADLSPKLNRSDLRANIPVKVSKGDELEFGKRNYGVRAYLAIKDGFQSSEVLQSRSFYDGITEKSRVTTGDVIPYKVFSGKIQSKATIAVQQEIFSSNEICVYEGPEFDFLSKSQQEQLFNTIFSIGLNNRMAYQLEETIKNDCPSIITSAVLPGTIQLTPSGKLIVLMKDCQTTGGYPRILQLDQRSIIRLAQKHTRDQVYFKKLSIL
ncbi:biotin-dependent carboxyltransferase family protein [Kordia algicida OT-1]|uniref:Allophanate hydrolase subunit 2 n=1 Tax=Kordia algicida OT-1 TaxID=391587 RepID=A9DX04_9FLAO|nr:biotin-dependent carboxyltransferase family protein [Kordia algicida]EDP95945.1 Allophanate hydrolase subunit 2 [Kordia algicida OT-1]